MVFSDQGEEIIAVMPMDVARPIIILAVPVLIARLVVLMSYRRRSHPFWTVALPTFALLMFVTRVAANIITDGLFPGDSWGAAASWVFLVASQLAATVYGWWPQLSNTAKNGVLMVVVGLVCVLMYGIGWAAWPTIAPPPLTFPPTPTIEPYQALRENAWEVTPVTRVTEPPEVREESSREISKAGRLGPRDYLHIGFERGYALYGPRGDYIGPGGAGSCYGGAC